MRSLAPRCALPLAAAPEECDSHTAFRRYGFGSVAKAKTSKNIQEFKMNLGDIGSIVSAIVALVALILSMISMRKANKFGATSDRLNRILIEREQAEWIASKKADLSANMVKVGKNDYRLKIFNRGKGTARNVRLTDLTGASSVLIASDIQRKFPVPILEQHQTVELVAAVTLSTGPSGHIKLRWDDETGVDHEKELTPII